LALEKEPSSSSQNSSEPRGLLHILLFSFGFVSAWFLSKAQTRLEESSCTADSQDSTENTQGRGGNLAVPVRVVVDSLPTPSEKEKSYRQRKEGREKLNLGAQIITAGLVFVYATIAGFQYFEMIHANKLTSEALALNRRMFTATQAAGFLCQFNQNIVNDGTSMFIDITCDNRGKSGASNVTGEMSFSRVEGGRTFQHTAKPINNSILVVGGAVENQFFVTNTYSWDWVRRQDMTGTASLSYDNGIERVSQSWCWRLLIRPKERSTTFAPCEIYPKLTKTIK